MTRVRILKAAGTTPKGIVDLQMASNLDVPETSGILEELVAEGLLTKTSDGFQVLYRASARGEGAGLTD